MINTVKSDCYDSTLFGTFVENHDNPRFASYVLFVGSRLYFLIPVLTNLRYTEDISLAKNAAVFTIMSDGIPIIYAGQEQHYNGAAVPYNREAVWLSGYNTDSELYQLIAKTNAIRNQAIYVNEGYITYEV